MPPHNVTGRAAMACGKWLAMCLQFGWERDRLDALEALWWRYHHANGALKTFPERDPLASMPDSPLSEK